MISRTTLEKHERGMIINKEKEMPKDKIKIEYHLGGWNLQGWEGTVEDAMRIALGEIAEHEGTGSSAYVFTNEIFKYFSSK